MAVKNIIVAWIWEIFLPRIFGVLYFLKTTSVSKKENLCTGERYSSRRLIALYLCEC